MSSVKILTVSSCGIEAKTVNVQVHIGNGLPQFTIVGLPDKAINESKERIRSALESIGLALPAKRVIVNMSPADLQKEGSHYDLPIILGLLVSIEVISADSVNGYIAVGELSLDGKINDVRGVVISAVHALSYEGLICSTSSVKEAQWAGDLKIIAASTLTQLINHLNGHQIQDDTFTVVDNAVKKFNVNFNEVKGHTTAKRVMEIAAAGNHHMLMIGAPGAGKSMLAARFSTILPQMSASEALETSMIYSVAGINSNGLVRDRPFRDPHHNSSVAALVGGGHRALPGEISLAHNGVLFIDEMTLWSSTVLNGLREAMETGYISIARANNHVQYPAKFQLVAAMNPCPCGKANTNAQCRKFPICAELYMQRIPGPILDRFALVIDVENLEPWELAEYENEKRESSEQICERVFAARVLQKKRYENLSFSYNGDASSSKMNLLCISSQAQNWLNFAAAKNQISHRAYYNTCKVARSIADLENVDTVNLSHIQEAFGYLKLPQIRKGAVG